MLSDARNTKVLTATSNAYLRGVRATVCVCCLWRGRVGRRKRRGDFTWNRQGVRVCGGVMGHIEKKRITSARILLGKGKCEERERPPSPSPSPSPSVSVSPSPAPAPSPPVRLFNEPVRPDSPLHCVRMIGASPLLLLRPLLCSNRTHAQPNENATFALSLQVLLVAPFTGDQDDSWNAHGFPVHSDCDHKVPSHVIDSQVCASLMTEHVEPCGTHSRLPAESHEQSAASVQSAANGSKYDN